MRRRNHSMQPSLLSSAQFRGARAMLGWSVVDLAKAAGVSVVKIVAIEGRRPLVECDVSRNAIFDALEKAGVRFVLDGNKIGVLMNIER